MWLILFQIADVVEEGTVVICGYRNYRRFCRWKHDRVQYITSYETLRLRILNKNEEEQKKIWYIKHVAFLLQIQLTIFVSSRVKETKDSVFTGRCKDIISLLNCFDINGKVTVNRRVEYSRINTVFANIRFYSIMSSFKS